MDPKQKMNISTFLRTLRLAIKTRIAFSFCCSYLYNEKELIRYFNHLSRRRINEFLKGKRRHPNQGRQISFFLSRIIHWVELYKWRCKTKGFILSWTHGNRWGSILSSVLIISVPPSQRAVPNVRVHPDTISSFTCLLSPGYSRCSMDRTCYIQLYQDLSL